MAKYSRKWFIPLLLLIYHLSFSGVAYHYVLQNNGDAKKYWFLGIDLSQNSWSDYLKPGTDVIKIVTFPLVKYFQLSFFSGFLIFSLFSFLGIFLLYSLLQKLAGESKLLKVLSLILLFLPNLHFWTSLIGKEAIIFPFLVLFLWEVYHKRYFSFLLIFSLLFFALIRPHVAFVLIGSYVLSLLLTLKFSLKIKLIIAGTFIFLTGLFTIVLTQLQDFTGGFARVLRKYDAHIQGFKKTDAYVPLDQYPLPYKIFTFYFRPLPFEMTGFNYQIISIENALFLVIFGGISFYAIKHFSLLRKKILFVFPVLFLLFFAVMYVYAYANYGIIMRTRIMAVPFFYILILEVGHFINLKDKNAENI